MFGELMGDTVLESASRTLYDGTTPREPIYRSGDVFYLAPVAIAPLVPTRTTATYPTLPAQLPTTPIIPVPPPPVYTPLPVYRPQPTTGSSNLILIAALAIGAVLLLRGR